jgi:dienelactone hydrolase
MADEARAGMPDPLTMRDGRPVRTAEQWARERRPELLELFRVHVYGRAPVGRPERLTFAVRDTTPGMMDGTATRKRVAVEYAGPGGKGKIDLLLFVPAGKARRAKKRAPAFLLICNRDAANLDPERAKKSPFWPAEEIVARGYAAAAFLNSDVDPDKNDGFKDGAHGIFDPLFPGGKRPADAWGSIAAWAWGASRVLDYLETDPDVDARRVAVVGHSRGGKAALWAGAQDPRFALVVSNDSGCTGAAITRGKRGETVADINRAFPHWFCENYRGYAGRESELPVDQHELLALIAPRPVYVASATEDDWADPRAEFRSCVEAGRVCELLGKRGVGAAAVPPPEMPLQTGAVGYHLRTGKHDLTAYDWQRFMDFADRQWGRP